MKYYIYTREDENNVKYIYRRELPGGYQWYDQKDKTWQRTQMTGEYLSETYFQEIPEEEVFLEIL